MRVVELEELPGRSADLWLDTIDDLGQYDRQWLRSKVFTGRKLVVSPRCFAGMDIGLSCWRDYFAVRGAIFGAMTAFVFLVTQIIRTSGSLDGLVVGVAIGLLLAATGIGALIGNWLDYHVPPISKHTDDSVAIGAQPSQNPEHKTLWKRAIEAAIQADRESIPVYVDARLLEIHEGLRALADVRITGEDRKQMDRWVRAAVQRLEDEVTQAMMGRVGLVKEIAPLPPSPQLIEWSPTGEPTVEQEIDHAEELR